MGAYLLSFHIVLGINTSCASCSNVLGRTMQRTAIAIWDSRPSGLRSRAPGRRVLAQGADDLNSSHYLRFALMQVALWGANYSIR
jgi:hypothetical protein